MGTLQTKIRITKCSHASALSWPGMDLVPGHLSMRPISTMVTGPNLKALEHNSFMTRLPAPHDACKNAIAEAVGCTELGGHRLPDRASSGEIPPRSSRPKFMKQRWTCMVSRSGRWWCTPTLMINEGKKKLEKQIAPSVDAIAKKLKHFQKIYFCEADARKASSQAEKFSDSLHLVSVTIEPLEVRQRGRPSKNNPATDTRTPSLLAAD